MFTGGAKKRGKKKKGVVPAASHSWTDIWLTSRWAAVRAGGGAGLVSVPVMRP